MGSEMNLMRRLGAVCAVVLASALLAAPAAHAYPDGAGPTIEIDPHACAGDPVPFHAQSSIRGNWTVTYEGGTPKPATASNTNRIEGTLPSKKSDVGTNYRFTATVTGQVDGQTETLSSSMIVKLFDCSDKPGDNGALPSTGSDLSPWWLLLAAGAVAVGGGIVLRRRSH